MYFYYSPAGWGKIRHLRVNQESEAPASEHTDVGTGTLEKDFGMSKHAGGLFPNGHRSVVSDQPFSNWIGSYSGKDVVKMQADDPDHRPRVEHGSWRRVTDRPGT